MATQIKIRGGTTSQHSSFTGGAREITVDTDKNTVVVHDGSTAGGFALAKADGGTIKALSYEETFVAVTSTTNATTINCEAGNNFSHTLTENTTFTFSNPPANDTAFGFTLKIVQDAGASGYTVTWPITVEYPGATAPTLTATANAVDVLVFYTHDGGTEWYGFVAGQAFGYSA